MIIRFLILGWFVLIAINIIVIRRISRSIKPLKEIVLNGFLEKYRHKFITYIQEAIIDIKHGENASMYRDMDINKKDICRLALIKLKQDCIENRQFSAEVDGIRILFGRRQIADLILYNFNTLATEDISLCHDAKSSYNIIDEDQFDYDFNPDDYDINESDIKELNMKAVSIEELEKLSKLSIPIQIRNQQSSEYTNISIDNNDTSERKNKEV